ncbi:MAG: YbjQ family protein [Deltaproteobacteria bacterium]|nr:YbjQ family protein [Deltaproteobacteria bacterium]
MTSPQGPQGESPYRVGAEVTDNIIVTTGGDLDGYRVVSYLGIVRGIVVRSASLGQGIVGAFKSLGGGNIDEWSQVCEEARHEAYALMLEHARQLGADAVVAMRYDATEFMQGATEVLAYGTAVRISQREGR